jgi:hypothetical protein
MLLPGFDYECLSRYLVYKIELSVHQADHSPHGPSYRGKLVILRGWGLPPRQVALPDSSCQCLAACKLASHVKYMLCGEDDSHVLHMVEVEWYRRLHVLCRRIIFSLSW